jgi:hypothetical protein
LLGLVDRLEVGQERVARLRGDYPPMRRTA